MRDRVTKIVQKEVAVFLILMVLLSLLTHPDLLSSPIARLDMMQELGNYLHPLLWSMAAYILIGIIRLEQIILNQIKCIFMIL